MPCLSKQCRSRSAGSWRSQLIWICTVCHLICENLSKNPDQVIWLAGNYKWAWHLNLFSMTRVKYMRYIIWKGTWTLKIPILTEAETIWLFFNHFSLKIKQEILCELSVADKSHETSNLIFYKKLKKKMVFAAVEISTLRVKRIYAKSLYRFFFFFFFFQQKKKKKVCWNSIKV